LVEAVQGDEVEEAHDRRNGAQRDRTTVSPPHQAERSDEQRDSAYDWNYDHGVGACHVGIRVEFNGSAR
jgi:hypothetical protein